MERFHAIEHPQAHFVISQLLMSDDSFDVKLSDSLAKLDPSLLSSWVKKKYFFLFYFLTVIPVLSGSF